MPRADTAVSVRALCSGVSPPRYIGSHVARRSLAISLLENVGEVRCAVLVDLFFFCGSVYIALFGISRHIVGGL